VAHLLKVDGREQTGTSHMKQFTQKDREILVLLCKGMSNKEICKASGLSLGTVKTHLGKMHKIFKVKSRVQLVIHAYELGLVDLP